MLFGFLYLFIFAAPSADGGLEKKQKTNACTGLPTNVWNIGHFMFEAL